MHKIVCGLFAVFLGPAVLAQPPSPPPHQNHDYDNTAAIISAIGLIGTALIANEIKKQNQQARTIIVREPNTKNRVVYWCESQRQFFPYCDFCPEGWQTVKLPE